LDKDQDFFTTQLDDYEKYLKEVKNSDDKSKKKFNFITENLNMLSFKPSTNNNVAEKKEEDNNLDIVKLNKFFKNSQKAHTAPGNLNISNEEIGDLINLNNESKSAQLVKNEILNSYFIEESLRAKKAKLDNLMSVYDLPKIEDYEGTKKVLI
jgi:hypothetical protein